MCVFPISNRDISGLFFMPMNVSVCVPALISFYIYHIFKKVLQCECLECFDDETKVFFSALIHQINNIYG